MPNDEKRINPFIAEGLERIRSQWPQSHAVGGKGGNTLVVVPSVRLCDGWLTPDGGKLVAANICTVLFIAPPGYHAACPDHFFTDLELRLAEGRGAWPHNVNKSNGEILAHYGWPQWSSCTWWSWHLQMWDPNCSSLFTYVKVIQQRLSPAR